MSTAGDPTEFPRRVLLAVSGLSPQIVTETLYALAIRAERPWIPTEIRLLTTARGAEHARLNLLSTEPGWFHRLRADYGLPQIRFDIACIEVIRDVDGLPLADIRSQADNDATADALIEAVRALTADPDCALHVSIAGGRKTMGYYLGYALSLFGRVQDRLSHVLVDQGFEGHPQFYYPSPGERVIHTLGANPRPLDCRQAEVTLAEIPFVRLREGQPAPLLAGSARFSEVVAALNRALAPPRLVIDVADGQVEAGGLAVPIAPANLAFLLWFARRARAGLPGLCRPADGVPDTDYGQAYLEEYDRLQGLNPRIEARYRDGMSQGDFDERRTRVNQALLEALGPREAAPYLIAGTGRPKTYRLDLPAGAITIEEN
ncbi:MAG: CRISPR-associated ring nuclease Csm6 [Pseudomonadota bacterium]|nr:CRISPR-associated ring nuclease Csm6 [Pseudomonadota bacterium]HJO35324.1 CRISPR-associated ring nuclease Csm6 [Gammaproteobacteria bacterium]